MNDVISIPGGNETFLLEKSDSVIRIRTGCAHIFGRLPHIRLVARPPVYLRRPLRPRDLFGFGREMVLNRPGFSGGSGKTGAVHTAVNGSNLEAILLDADQPPSPLHCSREDCSARKPKHLQSCRQFPVPLKRLSFPAAPPCSRIV